MTDQSTVISGITLEAGPLWVLARAADPDIQNGVYVMTEPQSQSQPGGTNENPNADVENGTQSTIQPGGANQGVEGGEPTGDSVASDGGNPAANQGGANGGATPSGGGQAGSR